MAPHEIRDVEVDSATNKMQPMPASRPSTAYNPESTFPDGIVYDVSGGRPGKICLSIVDVRNEMTRKKFGKHYPVESEERRRRLLNLEKDAEPASGIDVESNPGEEVLGEIGCETISEDEFDDIQNEGTGTGIVDDILAKLNSRYGTGVENVPELRREVHDQFTAVSKLGGLAVPSESETKWLLNNAKAYPGIVEAVKEHVQMARKAEKELRDLGKPVKAHPSITKWLRGKTEKMDRRQLIKIDMLAERAVKHYLEKQWSRCDSVTIAVQFDGTEVIALCSNSDRKKIQSDRRLNDKSKIQCLTGEALLVTRECITSREGCIAGTENTVRSIPLPVRLAKETADADTVARASFISAAHAMQEMVTYLPPPEKVLTLVALSSDSASAMVVAQHYLLDMIYKVEQTFLGRLMQGLNGSVASVHSKIASGWYGIVCYCERHGVHTGEGIAMESALSTLAIPLDSMLCGAIRVAGALSRNRIYVGSRVAEDPTAYLPDKTYEGAVSAINALVRPFKRHFASNKTYHHRLNDAIDLYDDNAATTLESLPRNHWGNLDYEEIWNDVKGGDRKSSSAVEQEFELDEVILKEQIKEADATYGYLTATSAAAARVFRERASAPSAAPLMCDDCSNCNEPGMPASVSIVCPSVGDVLLAPSKNREDGIYFSEQAQSIVGVDSPKTPQMIDAPHDSKPVDFEGIEYGDVDGGDDDSEDDDPWSWVQDSDDGLHDQCGPHEIEKDLEELLKRQEEQEEKQRSQAPASRLLGKLQSMFYGMARPSGSRWGSLATVCKDLVACIPCQLSKFLGLHQGSGKWLRRHHLISCSFNSCVVTSLVTHASSCLHAVLERDDRHSALKEADLPAIVERETQRALAVVSRIEAVPEHSNAGEASGDHDDDDDDPQESGGRFVLKKKSVRNGGLSSLMNMATTDMRFAIVVGCVTFVCSWFALRVQRLWSPEERFLNQWDSIAERFASDPTVKRQRQMTLLHDEILNKKLHRRKNRPSALPFWKRNLVSKAPDAQYEIVDRIAYARECGVRKTTELVESAHALAQRACEKAPSLEVLAARQNRSLLTSFHNGSKKARDKLAKDRYTAGLWRFDKTLPATEEHLLRSNLQNTEQVDEARELQNKRLQWAARERLRQLGHDGVSAVEANAQASAEILRRMAEMWYEEEPGMAGVAGREEYVAVGQKRMQQEAELRAYNPTRQHDVVPSQQYELSAPRSIYEIEREDTPSAAAYQKLVDVVAFYKSKQATGFLHKPLPDKRKANKAKKLTEAKGAETEVKAKTSAKPKSTVAATKKRGRESGNPDADLPIVELDSEVEELKRIDDLKQKASESSKRVLVMETRKTPGVVKGRFMIVYCNSRSGQRVFSGVKLSQRNALVSANSPRLFGEECSPQYYYQYHPFSVRALLVVPDPYAEDDDYDFDPALCTFSTHLVVCTTDCDLVISDGSPFVIPDAEMKKFTTFSKKEAERDEEIGKQRDRKKTGPGRVEGGSVTLPRIWGNFYSDDEDGDNLVKDRATRRAEQRARRRGRAEKALSSASLNNMNGNNMNCGLAAGGSASSQLPLPLLDSDEALRVYAGSGSEIFSTDSSESESDGYSVNSKQDEGTGAGILQARAKWRPLPLAERTQNLNRHRETRFFQRCEGLDMMRVSFEVGRWYARKTAGHKLNSLVKLIPQSLTNCQADGKIQKGSMTDMAGSECCVHLMARKLEWMVYRLVAPPRPYVPDEEDKLKYQNWMESKVQRAVNLGWTAEKLKSVVHLSEEHWSYYRKEGYDPSLLLKPKTKVKPKAAASKAVTKVEGPVGLVGVAVAAKVNPAQLKSKSEIATATERPVNVKARVKPKARQNASQTAKSGSRKRNRNAGEDSVEPNADDNGAGAEGAIDGMGGASSSETEDDLLADPPPLKKRPNTRH